MSWDERVKASIMIWKVPAAGASTKGAQKIGFSRLNPRQRTVNIDGRMKPDQNGRSQCGLRRGSAHHLARAARSRIRQRPNHGETAVDRTGIG